MAVKIHALEDNARKTSIKELADRLADASAFSMAVKQAHWNMKGPNFIAVHEFLDQVYARVLDHVDDIAERIQVLDGVAEGTAEHVAKASSLAPYPTNLTKTEDHLAALCERLRDYGGKLRKSLETVEDAGDANTADLLTEASREADKDLWFLQSHLD